MLLVLLLLVQMVCAAGYKDTPDFSTLLAYHNNRSVSICLARLLTKDIGAGTYVFTRTTSPSFGLVPSNREWPSGGVVVHGLFGWTKEGTFDKNYVLYAPTSQALVPSSCRRWCDDNLIYVFLCSFFEERRCTLSLTIRIWPRSIRFTLL